jgi:hypothetical protein
MKNFLQFVNEMQGFGNRNILLPRDFVFAIDIRNSTREEQELALVEFAKFTEIRDYVREYLLGDQKEKIYGTINAWLIIVSGGFSRVSITYSIVTTTGWVNGSSYKDKFITLKEFLTVGLPDVPEYIHIKNDVNKYNL